jgi:hypothetical protein
VAEIVGDGRPWTVLMISLLSMPCRYTLVMPRLACPSCRGWPDHFYAGGQIYRAGADITQVELRFANGVTLSDDADADVALFVTEGSAQLPATAVLLGPSGNEVRSETVFR